VAQWQRWKPDQFDSGRVPVVILDSRVASSNAAKFQRKDTPAMDLGHMNFVSRKKQGVALAYSIDIE